MTDLLSDPRIASAFFAGMDIFARAQYLAGFAGKPAKDALRLTSKGAQLKFLEQTALELSPNVDPTWWSADETGFYRPVYKTVLSRLSGDDVSADDIMAEALADESKPPFWRAGLMASSGPLAKGILGGTVLPKRATGLPINFILDEVTDYIRAISVRRRVEKEESEAVREQVHPGAVGGFDQEEWEMVVEGIFDNADDPISKGFFAWLKSKVRGAETGAARTMDQFIDLALTGKYKNEAEIARALGMPNQAYLNKVVKEFTPMIAGWLAKGKGDVGPIRDLLSDRAFLMKLLKGKGDVPYKYAKLLRKASLIEAAKKQAAQNRLLSASDYVKMLTTAKFPAGKSMTVDEVAKVVGPEFKEMNENPPESVKKVMEGMKQASRILLSTDAFAEMLRDSKFEKGKPADPTENMSAEDAAEWKRQNEENKDKFKTAAAGLYGFTKSAEKSCTGAAGKLAKYAAKLAKELYTKDADTAPFLEEHAKRGFKTAKMIRNAMADVGPGPAPKTKTAASKSGMGLYGFKDKTAAMAMNACSELHQAAGHLAADLAMKFGEKQADGAAFLKKHAKAAKCAYSDLILDSYPSAPVKVAEEKPAPAKPEKKAPAKKASYPTVEEILAWDTRKATSFMASAEDDLVAEDLISDDLISDWDAEVMAGRTWDGDKSKPDDASPYNKHPDSPPAGADGSEQRWKYNKWFRENVCPGHLTGCGIPSLQG